VRAGWRPYASPRQRGPRGAPGGHQRQDLAFTRYCFTSRPSCMNQSSFYCPPHQHCPHGCNTIAIVLRNIRPPSDPPFLCHTYTIGLTLNPRQSMSEGANTRTWVRVESKNEKQREYEKARSLAMKFYSGKSNLETRL